MSWFSPSDLQAIWLTIKLASLVTIALLIIGAPIAWWLSKSQSPWRAPVSALVALPLILPPSVLGFYLLLAFGPSGPIGYLTDSLALPSFAFSFTGLVIGSIFYSLPFVVQPLQNAFASIGPRPFEAAATMRANAWDTFWHVAVPLARPGFITAAVLGFTHTVGEFGVVLMIGGNIPGETQVVSVQIYEHVEALDYQQAHSLSFAMVLFSFVILVLLYRLNPHSLWGWHDR